MNSTPKIVPISACIPHEGVLSERVTLVSTDIQKSGGIRIPLLAIQSPNEPNQWVIIDGMHRFAACQQLGLQQIPICEVDYNDPNIILMGWDAITHIPFCPDKQLFQLFSRDAGFIIEEHPWQTVEQVHDGIHHREYLMAVGDRAGTLYTVKRQDNNHTVAQAISAMRSVDTILDQCNPEFIADDLSLNAFSSGVGKSLILRPRYTKQEVLQAIQSETLFPHKSTRHIT